MLRTFRARLHAAAAVAVAAFSLLVVTPQPASAAYDYWKGSAIPTAWRCSTGAIVSITDEMLHGWTKFCRDEPTDPLAAFGFQVYTGHYYRVSYFYYGPEGVAAPLDFRIGGSLPATPGASVGFCLTGDEKKPLASDGVAACILVTRTESGWVTAPLAADDPLILYSVRYIGRVDPPTCLGCV